MPLTSEKPFGHVHFSREVIEAAKLPGSALRAVRELPRYPARLDPGEDRSLVVLLASELIRGGRAAVPGWVDTATRYLVVVDIPESAVLRLPTILQIHKPDQRMHLARDPAVVKRQAIALYRDVPEEGIVDAYMLDRTLNVILGDMSCRSFPASRIPSLDRLDHARLEAFEIHTSGSYLRWPDGDLRLGVSQLLQAVDPMHLADIEIHRYAVEKTSLALRTLRENRGLTQSDIHGLSERHVRRLEKEKARLTVAAAEKYAGAFGLSLPKFLDELSRTLSALGEAGTASASASGGAA